MFRDDFRNLVEHWDNVMKQQGKLQTNKKTTSTSFFTDTKSGNGGPDAELIEGWHKIMGGAEDLDSDYRSATRSDELAADEGEGWLSKDLEDFGPPPTGRAGENHPEVMLNEEKDHWQDLAHNLKTKENKSVQGSGYLNTSDAAKTLGMTMEHFLRCVWNIPEFVKPEPFEKGMAYNLSEVNKIKETLVKEGINFPRTKDQKSQVPKEGFGKLVRGDRALTKKITYNNEPTTFWSVGKDQNAPPDGPTDSPVRVSKFSSSKEFDEIAELKRQLEIMERRVHKADVEGNKGKRDKLTKELVKMRKEIEKLSEKAQSKADTDIT